MVDAINKFKVGVKVPGLYELLVMEPDVYGFLVGRRGDVLLYVPFDGGLEGLLKRKKPIDVNKEGFVVKEFSNTVLSVLAVDDALYIGLEGRVGMNDKNLYVLRENGWDSLAIRYIDRGLVSIEDIAQLGPEFGCKVVVGGIPEALFDVNGNQLIPFEEFHEKDILGVEGIVGDDGKDILLLLDYFPEKKIVRAIYENGKFRLGVEVFNYGTFYHSPFKSRYLGKEDTFNSPQVVSTFPYGLISITNTPDNKVVLGSFVNPERYEFLRYVPLDEEFLREEDYAPLPKEVWTDIKIIRNDKDKKKLEILAKACNGVIEYMEIGDYTDKPFLSKRKSVAINSGCRALGVVRSEKLHEMLMSLGGKG